MKVETVKIIETKISVGANAPFSVLHISDTHLTLADEFDNERKHELAQKRSEIKDFREKEAVIKTASEISKKEGLPIFHTGDLIDFVSHANLKAAKKFAEENDLFLAAGNHEFSQYVGEAEEDADYRNQSLALVQAAFKNDIRFSSRVINGVNFVALDNSYYLIEEKQLECLKDEVEKGLPIVLLLHTPLYEESLYTQHRNKKEHSPVFLMNVPQEKMEYYSPERYKQQRADSATENAYDYILSEPAIKAILAGHLHYDFESAIDQKLPQFITGCSTIRKIEFC